MCRIVDMGTSAMKCVDVDELLKGTELHPFSYCDAKGVWHGGVEFRGMPDADKAQAASVLAKIGIELFLKWMYDKARNSPSVDVTEIEIANDDHPDQGGVA